MCFKLPATANKDSDLKAASTLGVGWISAAQALKQRLFKDEIETGGRSDTVSFDALGVQIARVKNNG